MCGISGWVGPADAAEPELRGRAIALAMASAIAHRGPDGAGARRITGRGAEGWLGHRRLRVVDLSDAAAQPMRGERSGATLVFNGEIYNFRELRSRLAAAGHTFRSTGDTEVVLRAYEAWGPDFVGRLDGMFAIAVWDEREATLLLARDRTGKKPLFYHVLDGRLTFASEVKALARMPGLQIQPDPRSFAQFLTFGYVNAPTTIYDGIAQLPPASSLHFAPGDGSRRIQRWWSPLPARPPRAADDTLIEDVRRTVEAAVRRRTVADVPIGVLLSGGIDSSVVCALMGRHAKGVRTFSAGLADEPTFDERSHARRVAEHLGTEHTEFEVRADAVALLDRLVWLHDGPFADSSAVPTYLACEAARRDVTVVLTGDGGDEVFAGYRRFAAAAFARLLRPEVARSALGVLPLGDGGAGYHDRRRALVRFLAACRRTDDERYLAWVSVFAEDQVATLLGSRSTSAAAAPFRDALEEANGLAPIDRLIYANFATYLPGDLHVKVDRCSMAHGLEARSPLLDTGVIELMGAVRARDKVGLRRAKPILRRAFGSLLPSTVWDRPKHGFGVPMDAWFDGELAAVYRDEVLGRDGRLANWLEPAALARTWGDHESGAARNGPRLWTLLTMERWLRALGGAQPLAEPQRPQLDALVSRRAGERL